MPQLTQEIGVSTGTTRELRRVYDQALRELADPYRALSHLDVMRDTDPTAGAMISAIDLLCKRPAWHVNPADDRAQAKEAADFVEGVLFKDMSHSFDDFLGDALSMTTFGVSFVEVVWKLRRGPDETDPARRSVFSDGKIGLRKLVGRSMLSLDHWDFDATGGIQAFVQRVPNRTDLIAIPIERGLVFRTSREMGDPFGRSVLRSAYLYWRARRAIEGIEFVGIERELAGVPVVSVPAEEFVPQDDPAKEAARLSRMARYEQIARDLKFNDQGGLIFPSDPWRDIDGRPSGLRQYEINLIASAGTRSIDTSRTITRLDEQMARSVLAEFLMLGAAGKGSLALSKDKTDLFALSIEWYLDVVQDVLNRHLLPRLWQLNGFPRDLMPEVTHDPAQPPDIAELGTFVQRVAGAGIPLADPETENTLRRAADLPDVDLEAQQELAALRAPEPPTPSDTPPDGMVG